ncbi:U exon [Crane-associated adenovirus 1]|uniref:U exon n=1 Tax=Crane-associated adenovirus 1 TaxID=2559941 RepID=A0A5H2WW01_9ADEN|nr:U exon [Crane-associated adenovirus 1]
MSKIQSERFWINLNNQSKVYIKKALRPGFVFSLKRKYKCYINNNGGERVTLTRQEPFSDTELSEIYWKIEYHQQSVSTITNPNNNLEIDFYLYI